MQQNRSLTAGSLFLPYDRTLINRAKALRRNPTPAEQKLWNYLRTLSLRFLRQRPIDYFIVDFYCAQIKLVIEVDGDSHFTPEGIAADRERTARLEGYGLRVIRFTNHEVLTSFPDVCTVIEQYLSDFSPSL
jgi:very-short-patch-repair endonuclease